MERFRQDNTEGYSDADLAEMNLTFKARCNMLLGQYKEECREDVMQQWAEDIQAEFDATH